MRRSGRAMLAYQLLLGAALLGAWEAGARRVFFDSYDEIARQRGLYQDMGARTVTAVEAMKTRMATPLYRNVACSGSHDGGSA